MSRGIALDKTKHIGQKAIIKDNLEFIRCGYPLGLEEAKTIVQSKYKQEIDEVLYKMSKGKYLDTTTKAWLNSKSWNTLLEAFAINYLKFVNYGGKTRSIHKARSTEFEVGDKCIIVDRILKKTGIYVPGMFSSEDYENVPPVLEDQKVHKIYKVRIFEYTTTAGADMYSMDEYLIHEDDLEFCQDL
jgi:hypothetical protein